MRVEIERYRVHTFPVGAPPTPSAEPVALPERDILREDVTLAIDTAIACAPGLSSFLCGLLTGAADRRRLHVLGSAADRSRSDVLGGAADLSPSDFSA